MVRRRAEPGAREGFARPRPPLRSRGGGAAARGAADGQGVRDHRHARALLSRRRNGAARGARRKVTGSVSAKTTGLVVGEEPGASKLTKAQKADVPILSESDLLALLGES